MVVISSWSIYARAHLYEMNDKKWEIKHYIDRKVGRDISDYIYRFILGVSSIEEQLFYFIPYELIPKSPKNCS